LKLNIFRYPGGKSKLVNLFLDDVPPGPLFCEPFCGGASVSIAVAQRDPDRLIWLNDLDSKIAAFWQLVATGNVDALCDRILSTTATTDLFRELSTVDDAFAAIYLNRTAYSGKSHTSPVGGWNQTGKWKIDAEWRQEYLVRQIQDTTELFRDRLTVTQLDFRDVIDKARMEDAFFYVDPPYYMRGKTMYQHYLTQSDHENLAALLHEGHDWLLSYDNAPEIHELYKRDSIRPLKATYSAAIGKNFTAEELIIKSVGQA